MLNSPKHVQLFPCIRYMVNNFENADMTETEFLLYWIKEMRKKKISDRDINKYLSNLQLNTIGIISSNEKKKYYFNELEGIKVTSDNNYTTIADEILAEKYQQMKNCTCKSFFKNFKISNLASKEYQETLCSTCPYSKNYSVLDEKTWQILIQAFKDETEYKKVLESIESPEKYFKATIDINTYHGVIDTEQHFTVKLFYTIFNLIETFRNEIFNSFNVKKYASYILEQLIEPLIYLSLADNMIANYEKVIEVILIELYNDMAAMNDKEVVSSVEKDSNEELLDTEEDFDDEVLSSFGIDIDAKIGEKELVSTEMQVEEDTTNDVCYEENTLLECADYVHETINYMELSLDIAEPYTTLPLLPTNDVFLEVEKNKYYKNKLFKRNSFFGKSLDEISKIKRRKPLKESNKDSFITNISLTLQDLKGKNNDTNTPKEEECTTLLSKVPALENDAEPIVISQYILDSIENVTEKNIDNIINCIEKDKLIALETVYSPHRDVFILIYNKKIGYAKINANLDIFERLKGIFEMNSIIKITFMPYTLLSVLYNKDIFCKNLFVLYTALGCLDENYAKGITEFAYSMIKKPFLNEEYLMHMIKKYPAIRLVILDEIRINKLEKKLDNLLKRDIMLGNSFLNHCIYKNMDKDRYLFTLKGFNKFKVNAITDEVPILKESVFFNIKLNQNVVKKEASIELYALIYSLVAQNYPKKNKIYITQFEDNLLTFLITRSSLTELRDVILNELTMRLESYRRGKIKGPLFEYLVYNGRSQ